MSNRELLIALPALLLAGCVKFGQVEQARVIAYDRGSGTLTVIRDSNRDPARKPAYDVLPPVTVRTPADPTEMGPAPEAGKLLHVDTANRRIVFFHEAAQALRTIAYTPLEERGGVAKPRPPAIDRNTKTITLYVPAQRALVSFAASEEMLALPEDTWKAGDEVRYYFKQPGQALRLMNVTKTDLSKSGG